MKMKKCIVCEEEKKIEEFGIRCDNQKVRNTCKQCINQKSKENKK